MRWSAIVLLLVLGACKDITIGPYLANLPAYLWRQQVARAIQPRPTAQPLHKDDALCASRLIIIDVSVDISGRRRA
jgi:hypothetical protein